MKIVKAMKKVSRLQGEIKTLQSRFKEGITVLEGNEFGENISSLHEELDKKTKELIRLKNDIMKTNIKHDMFPTILILGELKKHIEFLKDLEVGSGFRKTFEGKDEYKSQMSLKEKNYTVQKCQEKINELTDKLDDFNASTDIERSGLPIGSLDLFQKSSG